MRAMSKNHWSNRENSSSTDSSETSDYGAELESPTRVSRRGSIASQYHCSKGHELLLVPVTCERKATCGCCSANIRMKPAQVLCYHCYDCDYDCCGECVTKEMKDNLIEERSRAMTEIEYYDCNGEGLYLGSLSENDRREGHGIMKWTCENSPLCGSVYEGYWKDDQRHGHGKFIYPDGGVYEGLWEHDEKSGYGRRSFSNGFKYHGSFKNGMKNGKGIFKGVTGRWCFAAWKNDQMVGPAKFAPKVKVSTVVYDD